MSTDSEDVVMASYHAVHSSEFINSTGSSTVRLLVGHEQKLFEVKQDLLCSRCPFFLNAFNGNFIESQTRTFNFPDDEPNHFAVLCTWLESNSIYDVEATPTWLWLVKTWLFAEKYHIDELQNEVIDAIHTKFAGYPDGINISFETLDYVAENTTQRSPLRRIFADMLTNGISLQQLPNRIENIPAEFLQDMCLALKSTISRNGPTNIALLTNPISTYYISSASCKATAMPKETDPSNITTNLHCHNPDCRAPIRETLHIELDDNVTLCDHCRRTHRGHRKKMITLTSPPYTSAITGERTSIIDGHMNDHGYYCDGPDCEGQGHGRASIANLEYWAILSGDRYHCLQCANIDFCTVCIRGPLKCKDEGHSMLRIRPTFSRKVPSTENVTIRLKQERSQKGLCWRCGGEHPTNDCDAKEPVLSQDVEAED